MMEAGVEQACGTKRHLRPCNTQYSSSAGNGKCHGISSKCRRLLRSTYSYSPAHGLLLLCCCRRAPGSCSQAASVSSACLPARLSRSRHVPTYVGTRRYVRSIFLSLFAVAATRDTQTSTRTKIRNCKKIGGYVATATAPDHPHHTLSKVAPTPIHATSKEQIQPQTYLICHDEDAPPHPPIVALGGPQGIGCCVRIFIIGRRLCSCNSCQGSGVNCPAEIVCHPVQW